MRKESIAVASIPYSEDVELLIGDGFSPEDRQLIDYKLAAHKEDCTRNRRIQAKYTIEVLFGTEFSFHRPSAGAMSCLENGARDGEAQGSVYICPDDTCGRPITQSSTAGELAYCFRCKRSWEKKSLGDMILLRLSIQGWTDTLLRMVQRLDLNTDIRLINALGDIREAALTEQQTPKDGELMGGVRRGRVARTYWLHDIVTDTSHGVSLRDRILAFLQA